MRHRLQHAPFALRRSVLAEIEKRFPDEMAATVGHRFRHPGDIPVASALAHHFGAATARAVPGELTVVHENLGGRRLGLALERLLVERDADSICINETEVWEVPQDRAIARFARFLERYFPVPSPWEAT